MNMTLFHGSFEPLLYGVIIFLSILSVVIKLKLGMILAPTIEVLVASLVFWMHGGTLTGGMAAVVAGLLSGLFIPMFVRS